MHSGPPADLRRPTRPRVLYLGRQTMSWILDALAVGFLMLVALITWNAQT